MTETTAPALHGMDYLAVVHPHHVARINAHNEAQREGALVTFTGRGEFYSGIASGSTVAVTGHTSWTTGHVSLSVQRIEDPGAHLGVQVEEVVTVPASEWTREQAWAAKVAAEVAATGQVERAYASANRLLGAPGTDEAALAALRYARDLRDYAFAVGVLASSLKMDSESVRFRKATA